MRIARFTTGGNPRYAFAQEEGERTFLAVLSGDPLVGPVAPTGERVELADPVRLLAPVIPRSKVVAVGMNYVKHIEEMGHPVPVAPILTLKPNTSIIGPGDPVMLPHWSREVSYEVELAVVIGRLCRDVSPESARDYVLGYTVANDLTARDAQRADTQWARSKGFDSACPLGPWIETDLDPDDLQIRSWVDGQLRQDARTSDMVFDPEFLISYISEAMTLLPGDVIITGTPAGVGKVVHGDVVECEIEGIGLLRNPVLRLEARDGP